jgi:hypothetical protein
MECNCGMYNQYNKNKTDGLLIWPKFEQGLQFYIPIGAIFVELEGSPDTKEKHESELALVAILQ